MMNTIASLKNNFLIAMPSLYDPFFHQSVVYLCEHSDEGAMGLIVNRPSKIMLAELLDHLELEHDATITDIKPVLFGGPVAKNQGLVLHDNSHADKNSIAITETVFLSTSTDILTTIGLGHGPKNSLITLGYASWMPGQLEQEIADNDWLNVTANEDILFHSTGLQSWQQAAALLGVNIDLMPNITGHA